MRLRLTVVASEIEVASVNVEIEATPGTTLAAVAEQLAGSLVSSTEFLGNFFHVRGQQIPPNQPLGLPPLLQGTTLILGQRGAPPPAVAGALEIHVVAGPDAGQVLPVRADRPLVVGRSRGNELTLADPDVSRHHAEISASDGLVHIRDLASVNGTWLSSCPLDEQPQLWKPDAPVRLGGSTLMLRVPDCPVAATTPDGSGHLLVNRRSSLLPPRPTAAIEMPAPPQQPQRQRLPWLMVLAPLFLAVPAALIWRQPGYLLFAALSPLLMLAQYVADRRRASEEGERLSAGYAASRQAAEAALTQALAADAEHLETTYPDLARIEVTARIPTDELWQRTWEHPAALEVRLGRGQASSAISVRDLSATGPLRSGDARPLHSDVPVVLQLLTFRVVGVSGPRPAVLGTARAVVGQLAVLHSPHDLAITLIRSQPGPADLNDPADDWEWLAWLPHQVASGMPGPTDRLTLLVLDGAHRLRRRTDVADLLARAAAQPSEARPGATAVVICLEHDEASLPLECNAVITHAARDPGALLRRTGQPPLIFWPDLAGPRWSTRLARSLAPLRDATVRAHGTVPDRVRLLDLLRLVNGVDPLDPAALADCWRPKSHPAGPEAVLGMSAGGPVTINLRTDGPHLLVGGTTGSGKSELLQTLIASLAARSGPEQLTFLLVDYKGGAAFQSCAGLPHVGAVLTDLDPQNARRALSSFRSELRRREQLLLQAGVVDISEYTAPALPAMPRLVVIVDEFRVLAEELPEFVTGLIRIATVGRSLGVHLVLATQRPAGVVSPDIAANTNLRIALRVRDAADSRDLIADPAAADLPSVPGRALLRIGADSPLAFQTAHVGGTEPGEVAGGAPAVRLINPAQGIPRPVESAPEKNGELPSDLERMVTAARTAAEKLGLAQARAPWLPELPSHLSPELLGGRKDGRQLPFGLADLPDQQRQEPAVWDLEAGHLAIVGGPRSGRSSTLRSVCTTAGQGFAEPDSTTVHSYLIDSAGQFGDLERTGLAHAVVRPDDHERAGRLLRMLARELRDRQAGQAPNRPVLLLVDGWEALITAWSDPGLVSLLDELLLLLRDGPGSGICAAVTGSVPLLTGQHSSLFAQRLVLTLPDPADAMVVGVPGGLARSTGPPGRGVWLASRKSEFRLVQVAHATDTGPPEVRHPSTGGIWDVPALPIRLSRADLPEAGAHDKRSKGLVPIGIGGERVQPVRLDVTAEPVTVILGSRGSGRTTAMLSLSEGLVVRGLRTVILSGRSMRRPGAATDLAARLAEDPGLVVLLDLPLGPYLTGPGADELAEVLALHLAGAGGETGHLVLTASGADIVAAYRGVLTLARDAQQGLVLGTATAADGEVLGVRLDRRPAGPSGRGVLVSGGQVVSIQVAHPVGTTGTTESDGKVFGFPHSDMSGR